LWKRNLIQAQLESSAGGLTCPGCGFPHLRGGCGNSTTMRAGLGWSRVDLCAGREGLNLLWVSGGRRMRNFSLCG